MEQERFWKKETLFLLRNSLFLSQEREKKQEKNPGISGMSGLISYLIKIL